MKRTLFTITFLIVLKVIIAQSCSYPKGGYANYSELLDKTPSISFDFSIKKRTTSNITMSGGADYKITSQGVSKNVIKKEIFAISTGDTLFLNCYQHYLQTWYAKVISEGEFLVFFGPVSNGKAARLSSERNSMGAVNGAIVGGTVAALRDLYILDTSFRLAKPMNRGRLRNLLEDYPELLRQYNMEPDKNDKDVMLDYLIQINEQ